MPNPLPQGFAPRSLLDSRTIVAAGRLVMEKQFTKLVHAFGDVADQLPGLAAADPRPGPPAAAPGPRDPQARAVGPGRAARQHAPTWPASGRRASICALTSRAEGFPLGLQEAMAAGVPCVSFDCASGPREIVRHEVNGLLVAPESIAGMSAALLRLGTDDDLRHRLGAGALDTAAEWDADLIAARWVEIFEAAIAAPGRPAAVRRPVGGARAGAARPRRRTTPRGSRRPRPGTAALVAGGRGRPVGDATSGWWCRRTRPDVRSWCCRWPPGTGSSRSSRRPTCRRTSPCATRPPTAGTSAGRRSPSWPPTCSAAGRRWWPSSPGRTPPAPASASVLGQGCTVEVEFWEEGVDGQLVAPTPQPLHPAAPPRRRRPSPPRSTGSASRRCR